MEESDPALVDRVLNGDRDAFQMLVERHSRSVFQLGYRMTGNQEDAEDIVQETFLRAFRNLKRYESRSSFSTWLYRIAANYSLDMLRSRRRFVDCERRDDSAGWLDGIVSQYPSAHQLAFSGQIRNNIEKAMNELTVVERTAFILRHYQNFSIEQIGAALGVGENAAKHSIFRAVRKLRRALEPLVTAV
jgi:RNA polymerase sigma-70 factor (ECF subfamily)